MKKKSVYTLITFICLGLTGVLLFYRVQEQAKKELITPLLPRNASLAQHPEWELLKASNDKIIYRMKKDPADIKSLLSLTSLYIREGRSTGNLSYYNEAAMKCVRAVLKIEPGNFEALLFQSMILLSQHRFDEGLQVARQVQATYPYNAFIYGLIVDANVELGNYPAALEAAEKMISIRPDLRSYSRIAYLREIHGDLPGAVDAMKLAIDAGAPGDENTEWCRIQLAKLYEQTGNMREAKMQYMIADENRPQYAYAKAGLAGIALVEKDYIKALSLFKQAYALVPDHIFREGMIQVYQLTGKHDLAKSLAEEILLDFEKAARQAKGGQNEDHEMAHAYMGTGNYEKALQFALLEYQRRPANIEMNETVARVYAAIGEYDKALPYIEAALKTNCRKPELRCLAGIVFFKTGDKIRAKSFLQETLKNKPIIETSIQKESEEVLTAL